MGFDEWVLVDSDLIGDLLYSWAKSPSQGVVFGTCDADAYGEPVHSSFKPIPASELTVSEGLTLDTKFPLHLKDDPYDGYYVTLRPDADGKDYTVSEKGMIGSSFDEQANCTSADAMSYIWQAKNKSLSVNKTCADCAADFLLGKAI